MPHLLDRPKFPRGTSLLDAIRMDDRLSHLASEWSNKNTLSMSEVTVGSDTRTKWVCSKNHTYTTETKSRARGQGCTYCAGKAVWVGYNDLASRNPEVAARWDYQKNDVSPDQVLYGSNKEFWWLCADGHSTLAQVSRLTLDRYDCAVCSGYTIIEGVNDLATTRPALAVDWDYLLNTKGPNKYATFSEQKVSWVCSKCDHRWSTRIRNRSAGQGCPNCAGGIVNAGVNDFATCYPDIAAQWSSKNSTAPNEYLPKSHKRVTWQCSYGHEWNAVISSRVNGRGCPVCANKEVLVGFNDLPTISPALVLEWSASNEKRPTEVTIGSSYVATWICSKGHEWRAMVSTRIKNGCEKCSTAHTSKIESALRVELSKVLTDVEPDHTYRLSVPGYTRKLQLDIVGTYRGLSVVVEYDGERYHSSTDSVQKDTAVTKALLNAGYLVVRIREKKLPLLAIGGEALLQFNRAYSRSPESLSATAELIRQWLDEFCENASYVENLHILQDK